MDFDAPAAMAIVFPGVSLVRWIKTRRLPTREARSLSVRWG